MHFQQLKRMHCNLVPRAFPLKNGCSGIKQENVNIYIVLLFWIPLLFRRFVRSPYSVTILVMTVSLNFRRLLPSRFYSLRLYDSRTRVFNIRQRCSQTGHSLVIVERVFNKVHSGRLRPEVQPFILFIYHFWEKKDPFSIPSLDKWYPLHTYFRNSHPS